MRPSWRALIVGLGLMPFFSFVSVVSPAFADTAVREEQLLLPVQIGSHAEKLEALIVRPAGEGRFPIALIVNGAAGTDSPKSMHPEWLAPLAHDFANRGWLAASIVWPGYGKSTGRFMNEAGTCGAPNVAAFLDAHTDELAATLKTLQTRADVDPSVTLGVGFSMGGASMLDLAARPDRPLTAVINISGGVYHYASNPNAPAQACALYETDLIRNMAKFGMGNGNNGNNGSNGSNGTPTLWLYAANDPFFRPELVERMLAQYRSNGGLANFTLFPPFGTNGHTLYKPEASALTEPKIDDFLRSNRLPAMDDTALVPLLFALSHAARADVDQYLKYPTEKAIAMPDSGDAGAVYWYYGARSIDDARRLALAQCSKATGKACHIVAENSHLVDGWRGSIAMRRN